MLYIVSTPIGNLEDITFRAVRILNEVSLVAAEDTRHTRILFNRYDIHTPMTSYHEYNKVKKTGELIKRLKDGEDLALVSDAGTPGISDPGFHLIREAIKEGIEIANIPGPCACISALVLSGKPTDKFLFVGFLPVKKGKRRKILEELVTLPYTKAIYESPHRVLTLLDELIIINPDLEVVLARELTKKFEEVLRGTASSLREHFQLQHCSPKGEFVVII